MLVLCAKHGPPRRLRLELEALSAVPHRTHDDLLPSASEAHFVQGREWCAQVLEAPGALWLLLHSSCTP
jgi:hypothetical protein